ncbi:hypothetical protein PI95_034625 [Hassallia byssoidea VB512170]|uniref:Uncharacterized protein n=1 Tax=Hassallia byssoidea VB512170 TaxID=1304833 RepID=A0A846HLZ8_9CYAN|nr:hypothetical protein [Hassalia byssoidea]NEU77458.1 hypothetical protein [Hassalia byssoidea VB512170]
MSYPIFHKCLRNAIASTNPFSVTWVATLKPAFRKCVATDGIVKQDGKSDNSTSYLPV